MTRARLRDAMTLPAAMLMASGAALYNRYPLVYMDTSGYLSGHNVAYRSYFFTLFATFVRSTHTLWTIVFLNALMAVYLLLLVLREVFAIKSRLEFLVVIALLCILSSFPWYVGFAMPDIFTPLMVLGLTLLAFCYDGLGRFEKCCVIAITFASTIMHYSSPPVAIGLLMAALIVRRALRDRAPKIVPHLAVPSTVIVGSVVAIVISNYLTLGIATYSTAGYAFELSRLVQNGPAVAFLREHCPTRSYAACAYLDRLPMKGEEFLWGQDNLFLKVGFLHERKEGMEIIHGTIREHPLWVMRDAIANTIAQLRSNETADGLRSYLPKPHVTATLRWRFPGEIEGYLNSRQSRGELTHPQSLRFRHWSVLYFSFFYCVFITMLLVHDGQWLPVKMMVTVALAILLNAFVSGAIADSLNRYGSRIIWLIPLIAIASWRKALGLSDDVRARSTAHPTIDGSTAT